jgi:hypothetical protein
MWKDLSFEAHGWREGKGGGVGSSKSVSQESFMVTHYIARTGEDTEVHAVLGMMLSYGGGGEVRWWCDSPPLEFGSRLCEFFCGAKMARIRGILMLAMAATLLALPYLLIQHKQSAEQIMSAVSNSLLIREDPEADNIDNVSPPSPLFYLEMLQGIM